MEKCPLNHVYLCSDCHRGDKGPHNNRKRDLELKRNLQDKLELLFDKESFTMEEIKEVLKISDNAVIRLCKPLKRTVDKYDREDIIRSCMGGRIYE